MMGSSPDTIPRLRSIGTSMLLCCMKANKDVWMYIRISFESVCTCILALQAYSLGASLVANHDEFTTHIIAMCEDQVKNLKSQLPVWQKSSLSLSLSPCFSHMNWHWGWLVRMSDRNPRTWRGQTRTSSITRKCCLLELLLYDAMFNPLWRGCMFLCVW